MERTSSCCPPSPSAWPSGSITGLRTRGSTAIDVHWKDGRLVTASLVSAEAGTRTVRLGERAIQIRLRAGRPRTLHANEFRAI
ncbi:glycoside hydrolase family 95-like protein [Sphingomonas sp. H160509]|uniref:glycoside hydrolase family 95-like protein n=1 Tax=Sphingomonas sp. H160509 TaxID=2955313 RepID=UPI0031597D30